MAAMAHEPDADFDESPDLDEVLWQAWKALVLPEGYRAEIVEGFIEVSPTGRPGHAIAANRLRRALDAFLAGSACAAYQVVNVIDRHKVWIPDVCVGPEDPVTIPWPEDLGVAASGISLVAEVVSPGHDGRERDLVRKRRAYARAGIPVYVIIDDFDGPGHVTVLSVPDPEKAGYEAEVRMPYGTDVIIPEGPAKGFVIDAAITGEPRTA